jgi:DNA-binding MarR family transcriptional regulator
VLELGDRGAADRRVTDDEHRDRRRPNQLLGHRAEDEPAEQAVAAATDHDDRGVGAPGCGDDELAGGLSRGDVERPLEGSIGQKIEGVLAARCFEVGEGLFDDRLGGAFVRGREGMGHARVLHEDHGLDLIETEMAVLARALESMHRRSELYRDLDRASYLMARTLDTIGPASISSLASVLGLDATTVTRQVAAMEASKLVVRRSDPDDGRISLISLAPNGRRKMRAVQLARKERIASLLDDWTEDDLRQLGRLLARFNDDVSRGTGPVSSPRGRP